MDGCCCSGVRAIQLTPCTSKSLDKIKEAEESKEKTYQVLCWAERCEGAISAVEALFE